ARELRLAALPPPPAQAQAKAVRRSLHSWKQSSRATRNWPKCLSLAVPNYRAKISCVGDGTLPPPPRLPPRPAQEVGYVDFHMRHDRRDGNFVLRSRNAHAAEG